MIETREQWSMIEHLMDKWRQCKANRMRLAQCKAIASENWVAITIANTDVGSNCISNEAHVIVLLYWCQWSIVASLPIHILSILPLACNPHTRHISILHFLALCRIESSRQSKHLHQIFLR